MRCHNYIWWRGKSSKRLVWSLECLVSGGFIYGYFGRTWENNNWMILVARQPKGLQSEEHQGEKMLYQITLLKKTHVVSNSTHLKKRLQWEFPVSWPHACAKTGITGILRHTRQDHPDGIAEAQPSLIAPIRSEGDVLSVHLSLPGDAHIFAWKELPPAVPLEIHDPWINGVQGKIYWKYLTTYRCLLL